VAPDSPLLFSNSILDCALLYDVDSLKEVEAPNVKPLEWVCKPSANGTQAIVEFRVNVLTTQHQQNLFIIKIQLKNRNGQHLLVFSKPIKSVSKPEQVRRRISQHQDEDLPEDLQPVVGAASSKKRARSEELLTTLADIQLVQKQQSQMLTFLLSQQQCNPTPSMDFESLFNQMLLAYSVLPEPERPLKLRRLASTLSGQQKTSLTEICRGVSTDSLLTQPPAPIYTPKSCNGMQIDQLPSQICWDSLFPQISPSLVAEFDQLDQKGLDDFTQTYHQWLQ